MNEEFNVDEAQIGRVLHFVVPDTNGTKCRPAIVVEDWPKSGRPGYVNLQVLTDGKNDGKDNVVWETSVLPNHAARAMRSWHWPRECGKLESPPPAYVKDGTVWHHNHMAGLLDIHNCSACKLQEDNAPDRKQMQ